MKLILCTWENLWVTSLTLNLETDPSELYLTLNTHFDPIAFWPEGSFSYFQIWWLSRFYSSSSIAFLHHFLWIGLLIALLYVFGLCILLVDSMIDIAISCLCKLLLLLLPLLLSVWGIVFSNTTGVISTWATDYSITKRFHGRSLGSGSSARVFCFKEVSIGHFSSSLAPYSDLLIYGLLIIMTCFVWGAQTRKCFEVSGLHLISMPCQTFW